MHVKLRSEGKQQLLLLLCSLEEILLMHLELMQEPYGKALQGDCCSWS